MVENKGGAATQIGTKTVADAKPDGQTLGFIDTAFVINPGLFSSSCPRTQALRELGEAGVADLCAFLGLSSLVAMSINLQQA